MSDSTGTARHENVRAMQTVVTHTHVSDGVELEIIAEKAGADGWQLAIQNELGIRSVWYEFFATSQAAIEAGVKAIETEGVEVFLDTEGFEYLLQD